MKFSDALQPVLARWRVAYATSSVPGFLAWWGGQLRACLPERWRALLEDHVETLLLDRQGDDLDVYYASRPGEPPVARIAGSLGVDEQRLALAQVRAGLADPRVRTQICLSRHQVLQRTLQMPAAAERNLGQVLGFEMDRQTPFKRDQVYLDYRISGRNLERNLLKVEMAVIPRTVLDAELQRLQPMELALDGIDAWEDRPGGRRLGCNFLPPAQRVTHHDKRLWLNLGLGGAALLLLLAAMAAWLGNREVALQNMQTEVATVQREAAQVSAMRQGLVESIEGASFLMRKRSETPPRIQLLLELTEALADDTYLQRLTLDTNNRLSLQGMSDHAATILGKVSAIPGLTDASFQGVIQPDARSGKERFNILATVTAVAPAEASATKAAGDEETGEGGTRGATETPG